jgi:uncharacterized membrane protein YfcA
MPIFGNSMQSIFPDIDSVQLVLLLVVALFIGMSKTGVSGLGLAVVPLLAIAFGARESTGLMIPLLIMADIYAVIYYHRMAEWKHIIRLMPWAVTGTLGGVLAGNYISAGGFRTMLSVLVFGGLALMVIRDLMKKSETIPENRGFAAAIGVLGGFASMVGNAAGPVFAVYLLAMRLPKHSFIGTGAWFFFIINLFKLPFHIWVWKTVTPASFALDLLALPVIIAGAWIGIRIVRLFSEKVYRIFVVSMTFLSALLLLLR